MSPQHVAWISIASLGVLASVVGLIRKRVTLYREPILIFEADNSGVLISTILRLIDISDGVVKIQDIGIRSIFRQKIQASLDKFASHMSGEFGFTPGFDIRLDHKDDMILSSSYSIRDIFGFHVRWSDVEIKITKKIARRCQIRIRYSDMETVPPLLKTLSLYDVDLKPNKATQKKLDHPLMRNHSRLANDPGRNAAPIISGNKCIGHRTLIDQSSNPAIFHREVK